MCLCGADRQDALDKKLIVDLMAFAHRHAAGGARCRVVLVAGDADYAYTLSKPQRHTTVHYHTHAQHPSVHC